MARAGIAIAAFGLAVAVLGSLPFLPLALFGGHEADDFARLVWLSWGVGGVISAAGVILSVAGMAYENRMRPF